MANTDDKGNVPISKESKDIQKPALSRPLSIFEDMEREMERVFDRFGGGWMRPFRWERPFWRDMAVPFEGKPPSVDVIERDDEVLVKAELPGVDKNDLDVTMTDNTVTIKGSTRTEEHEEKGDYFRREVTSGSYSRTVTLPAEVDGANAKANFKDGLLKLTLPKVKKAKRHTIKVE